MNTPIKGLLGASLLALAGCASMSAQNDRDMNLADAQVAVRTEPNGDVIEEYRVANQLRMVKVTPSRGVPYYLMDENGDGRLDHSKGAGEKDISPVYWKLYGW